MAQIPLLNNYVKDTILSTPREKLVMMLYDGAIRHLNQSLAGLEKGDFSRFGAHLGKGQAIVAELLNSLDHDVSGEIAKNLERLYLYVIDRLIDANLNKEERGIKEALTVLKKLNEGWEHAVDEICHEVH